MFGWNSILIVAAAAVSLAACSPAPRDAAPAPAVSETTSPAGSVIAGVDVAGPLHFVGADPAWTLDITAAEIRIQAPGLVAVAPNSGPTVEPGEPGESIDNASWRAVASTTDELEIQVVGEPCMDGVSDRSYPLMAYVDVIGGPGRRGGRLEGCAEQAASDGAEAQ
jgi:uncharacterized membrane protein